MPKGKHSRFLYLKRKRVKSTIKNRFQSMISLASKTFCFGNEATPFFFTWNTSWSKRWKAHIWEDDRRRSKSISCRKWSIPNRLKREWFPSNEKRKWGLNHFGSVEVTEIPLTKIFALEMRHNQFSRFKRLHLTWGKFKPNIFVKKMLKLQLNKLRNFWDKNLRIRWFLSCS